jgi:hypothetical protein
MMKSPSSTTKAAAAAKKKSGKLDLFQSNLTKLCFIIVLDVVAGICCVPAPPFLSFFLTRNGIGTAW